MCPHCLQLYHYELEVRCADCDGPLCPSCAARLSIEVVELHCPDCGDAERAGAASDEA
ncbi:MAG TPA: hypothetical protein VN923_06065 [Thermoanaerobaculia bacterium]|nr:hypothetical protein [Thermoanaerobaculia bacterium]